MKKNKKGFTLIELLAVIVILGIILTIVVSNVVKYIGKARTGSYKDAYQIILKDLRTELLAKEMETGKAELTTCDDGSADPNVTPYCNTKYSGLYDKNNIKMTIVKSGTNYDIKVSPTTDGSFNSVKITNSDKPENTTVSASTANQTEGNILNSTIDSNGNISATGSVTNEIKKPESK